MKVKPNESSQGPELEGGRRAWAARCCLGLAVLGLWSGCAPEGKLVPEPVRLPYLKVMTYNIHHGVGVDGKLDVQRIARLIRTQQAGLVALQEVDRGTQRTQKRDLLQELATLTGYSFAFGKTMDLQGGTYGNALLSRFPIVEQTNRLYHMTGQVEPRGALEVTVDVYGRRVVVFVTHLDFHAQGSDRLSNIGQLKGWAQEYAGRPVVICGDFNATPDSPAYRAMAADYQDLWAKIGHGGGFTIPSRQPDRRIDYIWVSGSSLITPLKAWVPKSPASDHRPVMGFILLPEEPVK